MVTNYPYEIKHSKMVHLDGNSTVVCHLFVVVGLMHRWPGRLF